MPQINLFDPRAEYPEEYKNTVFMMWWKYSKPSAQKLYNLIPNDPITGSKPIEQTLRKWVRDDFIPKSVQMDNEFYAQVQDIAIQEKVEMLKRHSTVAEQMQKISSNWIIEHKDELTMSSSIRLLVEGIRIERESKGIPDALEKMSKLSDDELIDEIKHIMSEAGGEFLPNEIE